MRNSGFVLFFILFFCSCHGQQPSYQNIENAEFSKMMNQRGCIILDVRTPEEYHQGHVPHALLINFYNQDFSGQLDSLDKSKTYLVYCAKGGRSSKAAALMTQKGFMQVFNLTDGFSQWNGAIEK